MQDIVTFANWIKDAGAVGILVTALLGGKFGWYVWKEQHDREIAAKDAEIARLTKDVDKWENRAMRLLHVTEQAVK